MHDTKSLHTYKLQGAISLFQTSNKRNKYLPCIIIIITLLLLLHIYRAPYIIKNYSKAIT
jgi:hypothetical protein